MRNEIDLDGVYVPPLLVHAVLAIVPYLILRVILRRSGLYRLVWHRALFDIALYVLLVFAIDFTSLSLSY